MYSWTAGPNFFCEVLRRWIMVWATTWTWGWVESGPIIGQSSLPVSPEFCLRYVQTENSDPRKKDSAKMSKDICYDAYIIPTKFMK